MNLKDIFASLKERLKSNKDNYIEENSWCGDTESGFHTETHFDIDALYAEIDEFSAELAERTLLAAAPAPIQRGHDSDCAVHNAPAMPVGPCNCSLRAWEWAPNVKLADDEVMFFSSIYQTSEGLPVMTDCDEHGAWNVAIIFKRRADGVDYRHPVRIIPVDEAATPPALAWSQVQAAGDAVVDDLAMLVRRLVRSLEKSNPGTDLAPQALDYLKRKGLQGSPLRTDKPNADCSGDPANCPDNEGYGCACDPMNKAAMREQP